jgi:menaquinone-specific isochorismate synthase
MTLVSASARARLVARTTALDLDGADLLDHLGPGGFAWCDGGSGFVTAGVAAHVESAGAVALLGAIPHECERGAPAGAGPRAVGALPYAGSGRLTVPAVIVGRDADGTPWRTTIEPGTASPLQVAAAPQSRFTVVARTTRDAWHDAVQRVLARIAAGDLEKVVLARAVDVEADQPFSVPVVVSELRRTQPGCVVYADGGFVGASPELLVRKESSAVLARPLAGTAAGTPTGATALTRSAKDAREHRYVVDGVIDALTSHCDDVHADGPKPRRFGEVVHLATTVTARCAQTHTTVVDLMRALHPTPAVAGSPRDRACALIRELEPVGRGRYAGPCGWVGASGDGEFVVALRGAQIDGACARLHAGAGIVAGSDPESEWRETQLKLEPMLRVLLRP